MGQNPHPSENPKSRENSMPEAGAIRAVFMEQSETKCMAKRARAAVGYFFLTCLALSKIIISV